MEIRDLEKQIMYHAEKYYSGNPEISDAEFDSLTYKLKKIDPGNNLLKTTGWGYKISAGNKRDHDFGGMESIHRKPRSIDGIPDSYKVVRISPKYDGISCAVYFNNGMFEYAITRGDGKTGIDISDKMLQIIKIKPSPFCGAIRGELIMTKADWDEYYKDHPKAKDPRNVVAGIINRNEIDDDIKYITFKPYKVIANTRCMDDNGCSINDVNCMISSTTLSEFEFEFVSRKEITQEFLEELFRKYRSMYPCDGLVITDNSVIINDGVFNYDEVAYKFDGNVESTIVESIEWNRTRTGKMIPTIVFKPVELDGAVIRRCAGFNAKFIKDNCIGKDSEITIMRSGGVIPDIQEVLKKTTADIPDICPCCGTELEWNGVDLICNNKECSGNDESDLFAWVEAIATVPGLGYNIKKNFFNEYQIESVEDLYSIDVDIDSNTATSKKLKEMWDKLHIGEIDPVYALIALNIPKVGWNTAKKIVENGLFDKLINSLNNVSDLIPELTFVIGPCAARSINDNIDKIERLRFVKDRINYNNSENEVVRDNGEVVITGKLNTCKRSEFEKIINSAGFILVPAVKEGVKYLITNTPNSGSSKNRKADQLGIKKITENEFLEMISK